jgi:hypothetical protein
MPFTSFFPSNASSTSSALRPAFLLALILPPKVQHYLGKFISAASSCRS